jgi:hypothetical protein
MSNTYNTGNPVGSTDPRDLYDNASNFDDGMNTLSPSFTDRKGILRKSWTGMETEFDLAQSGRDTEFQQFLADSGFVSLGNYAAGLNFTAYNQYMARDGFFYRPTPSSIPFTTTGTWVGADEDLFVLFSQDDVLRQDLDDPSQGAGIVAFDITEAYPAGSVGDALKGLNSRAVESFGPVDTPANTLATMQAAIDYCAANNLILVTALPELTIDVSATSITIPDNFRCDLGNAWIKRETGNTTPHDMWVNVDTVSGNTGIDIRNVRFDGQRQADSLDNLTPAHRFCGLRLDLCDARVHNVRADNTVNAEVASDTGGPVRSAIQFTDSVRVVATHLYADGNNGTGHIANGLNYVDGVWANNNTGSGVSVRNCDDSYYNNINVDTSGYSGASFNGQRLRVSNVTTRNTPLDYAGIGFGHSNELSNADGCVGVNLRMYNCAGWGLYMTDTDRVTLVNVQVDDSVTRGAQFVDCTNFRILNFVSKAAATGHLRITGASSGYLEVDFDTSTSNGVSVEGSGVIEFGEASVIRNPATALTSVTGGILANAGCTIKYRGKIVDSQRYGALAVGAGAKVELIGSEITGSLAAQVFTGSGGVITYSGAKFSATDHTSGTFTILSGTSSLVVANGNVIDANRIMVSPADAAARTAGDVVVTATSAGTSFTATLAANAAANAAYRYVLL